MTAGMTRAETQLAADRANRQAARALFEQLANSQHRVQSLLLNVTLTPRASSQR